MPAEKPPQPPPVPVDIISDHPAVEDFAFGFDGYAQTLAGLIANKNNQTPLVIGIYGAWGTGKTTLMRAVQAALVSDAFDDRDLFRKCKTVWFQAWKYSREDEILAALIETIFKTMAAGTFFEEARGEIEKLTKRLDKSKIFGKLAELFTGVDVTEFFTELKYKEKLGFYDTFEKFFDDLVWTYINWCPQITKAEKPDDTQGALVIFIDDLDRCPEEHIVKVLETVKLFMDRKGCVFVIGAAGDIIEKALAQTYGSSEDARRFMEKIVQAFFSLPRIPTDKFAPLAVAADPAIEPHLEILMPALRHNPRQLKRFINNLNILKGLLRTRKLTIDPEKTLYWAILDHVYVDLAADVKDNPRNLFAVLDAIGDIDEGEGNQDWPATEEVFTKYQVAQSLRGYLEDRRLAGILRQFDVTPDEFEALRTLSGVVETPETRPAEAARPGRGKMRANMTRIDPGPFLFDEDKKETAIESPFEIDVYPVTNARFREFVAGGGYETERWWSAQGWRWREENRIMQPGYWEDEKWNADDHPVVGVSWYEADAYTRWANKALPTEQQWERAARGTDGREYPWEGDFDSNLCNTDESGLGRTSRVDRYPDGVSPAGCYDMAGNVWEWTRTVYKSREEAEDFEPDVGPEQAPVLKGGSWDVIAVDARCAYRFWVHPYRRVLNVGFRCVRTLK